jgi:hypothetical protein
MARLLSIGLLFCLITPFLAAWQFMSVQIALHRQWMATRIEQKYDVNDNEVLLKFSISEIHRAVRWEHAHEFEYQEEMYDIISTEYHGDTVIYRCYHDLKETQLRDARDMVFWGWLHPGQAQTKKQIQIYTFFQTLFQNSIPYDSEASCCDVIQAGLHPGIRWPDEFIGNPPTPPPEIS